MTRDTFGHTELSVTPSYVPSTIIVHWQHAVVTHIRTNHFQIPWFLEYSFIHIIPNILIGLLVLSIKQNNYEITISFS